MCRLGAQVAAGLAALHNAGLTHGDVKPQNIIVTAGDGSPSAKLIDFGGPPGPDEPVLATPLYAAPEVLAGQRPTAAADAYSLGAVPFALVTGLSRRMLPGPPPPAGFLGRLAAPNLTPTVPLRLAAGGPEGGGLRLSQLPPTPGANSGDAVQAAPVPQLVAVPAVVGMPADRTVRLLVEVSLRPETRQTYSTAAAGLVIAQDPPAGTGVAPGTTVSLTVSAGPAPAQADDD